MVGQRLIRSRQLRAFVILALCTVAQAQQKPADVLPAWRGIIGEYISGGDTLSVLERKGLLYVGGRSGEQSVLREVADDTFTFSDVVPLRDSACVFKRNAKGFASSVVVGERAFGRIAYGEDEGKSFRITPLKPASVLRESALKATVPKEEGRFVKPDLVEIIHLDSTIKLDVRYATTNNFMGEKFYSQARAFLQRPAAEALVRAHRTLRAMGYGLVIHDAYRPWYVTKMFWDATPEAQKQFVADPSKGSRHNRGCAIDVSLYEVKTGRLVEMPSGYDEFSHRAYLSYPGGTSLQRWHRELLRRIMEAEGFKGFVWEWWHFDFEEWQKYPIGTATFEGIH